MSEQKLERWIRRMDRAAHLLSGRLDEPPSLAELASAAAVSPFHFHRMWRALSGETIGQTVTRLRIEEAKAMLDTESASVTGVAMATGFASAQSFARAFRRQSGISPTEYRASPTLLPTDERAKSAVEIVRRDAVTVVVLRREGATYTALNETFGQVWNWADTAGLLGNLQGIYGMPLDDPESVPTDRLRYDAALAVGRADPPKPFSTATLPPGRYARARHLGGYAGLEKATQLLFSDWLLVSGEEPKSFPVLYNFLNDPDETPEGELETDILLLLNDKADA